MPFSTEFFSKHKELIYKIALAVLIILFLLNFAVSDTYKLEAFEIELDLSLSTTPSTIIKFPPIGQVFARTHLTPIDLRLTLEAIHQERLTEIIADVTDSEELVELMRSRAKGILDLFALRLALITVLGGIVGASLRGISANSVLIGVMVAIVIISMLYVGTYHTYDLTAFDDPHFEGMLEAAPWMVGLIQEGLENIEQLGSEFELIASNMSQLFTRIEALQPLAQQVGDLQVLHLSDIHNNPVGLQFVIQIANSFGVDLVIDTGDITDYGTPLEGGLLDRVEKLELPYVFIGGNHDSPTIIDKMAEFENLIVLESDVVEINGLTIAGIADPAAESNEISPQIENIGKYQQELKELVTDLETTPDIVVSHQLGIADPLIGEIPVLLHGHTHTFNISQEEGTTIIDAGTTGAAGLRGLQHEEGIPYSVALLHYNLTEDDEYKLDIVDIIKLHDRHGGFILERQLVEE
ncbi:metallophosphoesterase family protein [Natroniella sulfidigena]|uniref:metallophosphoesterase family protein n=1 Tax=Natroniella sulfidigena TaxID=723921 RepID=UPI00200A5262|nr:metallophosphoesterase [Natroniella sulfidigena]MCK8817768.1 metallophosphoesterase family protein [Natroniella sulfidigena]